jgi:hypothetical protein
MESLRAGTALLGAPTGAPFSFPHSLRHIHYISCDQSGPEAKGLILVIGGRMGDGTDYNHVGCTLKEHQKVGA